jgi:type II secretory pathway pseudopilin PulG
MKKSFTLIELLITSAIIMIMLGITIAYSQKGEGINKVNRSVERIAFDIRSVANSSMQTKQTLDTKICGWGIFFDEEFNDRYIIFSDFCEGTTVQGDRVYNEDEKQEEIKLSNGVLFEDVDISAIVYLPPEPRVEIYDKFGNRVDEGNISVTTDAGNFVKTLTINQAGTISTK